MPLNSEEQAARLSRAAKERGYESAAALAKAMGRPEPTVRSAMNGTRALTAGRAFEFAQFLGVTEQWLLYGTGPMRSVTSIQEAKQLRGTSAKLEIASQNQGGVTYVGELKHGPKDLPILGYVKAGEEAMFIGQGEVQGVTVRPDSLIGVVGAYAVRVYETSMLPILQPGWILHVDPGRPCRPGDLVVIQMNDGASFVKVLVRRTEKHIICSQLNPAGEVKYETAKHRSIHRVVGAKFLEE